MKPEMKTPDSVVNLAGDTLSGADGASGLPAKIARYSEARRRTESMTIFAKQAGHVKEAGKLAACSNYLLFRHYYTVDQVRLHAAHFCKKHLLCPMCAIRRASKVLTAYLERFEVVRTANPQLRPYLVTLTIKNGPDLRERMGHLRSSLRKMTQARRDHLKAPRKNRFVEFCRSAGGFHSFEVTNEGRGWHPHCHMVWMCETPPNGLVLSQEWHGWTGDSFIVDVRLIEGDPVAGFVEVCKYALKFGGLSLADNWHAYEVLSGQRMIDAHGAFRGVEVPEDLTDEPLDSLPFVELFYRYLSGVGYSFLPGAVGSSDYPQG